MQRLLPSSSLVLLVLLAACADNVASPRSIATGTPSFSKTTIADPTATFKFPLNDAALSVRGDHLYPDPTATYSTYADGICGVATRMFATAAGSNSGDATLQTAGTQDRRCAAFPRKLTLIYGSGDSESVSVFANVHELQSSSRFIPIGQTEKRFFGMSGTRCDRVQWGSSAGGDSVLVTRQDSSTWVVQTQAAPSDRAYCTTTGVTYHMPLYFIVVSSRPITG